MPIDYTHPNRINYEHPRRKSPANGAESPPAATGQTTAPARSRELRSRRDRGLRPDTAKSGQAAPTADVPERQPHGPTSPASEIVTCVCGTEQNRAVVTQCTCCGADLWSLSSSDNGTITGTATARARRPIGNLPSTPPPRANTGFIDQMQAFDEGIRERFNELLELSGPTLDAQWRDIAAAILALHTWDPSALNIEILRLNVMRSKISEWAARGGEVDLDRIGWTHVLNFIETIDSVERPGERDWTTGAIELQYRGAIPVEFDHLESVRRIAEMIQGVEIEVTELVAKMGNVFNAHIEDFARQNNCELEILTSDITDAILSRQGWELAWIFIWPTYFGQLGVYAYNAWVDKLPEIEWYIAKHIVDEAKGVCDDH